MNPGMPAASGGKGQILPWGPRKEPALAVTMYQFVTAAHVLPHTHRGKTM